MDSASYCIDDGGDNENRSAGNASASNSRPQSRNSVRPVEDDIAILKKAFMEAEDDGYPGLNRAEFCLIMKDTIGRSLSFEAIDTLFTKVDIFSEGYLKWLTFLDYFAQEYQEKDKMATNLAGKPYPHGVQEYESKRRDSIVSVCFMPTHTQSGLNYARGRYVTSDGVIGLWNMSIKFIASHIIDTGHDLLTPMLIYDMVLIYSLNLVAISTSVRDIVMFEISTTGTFTKSYHIRGLLHSALCLDFCQPMSKWAIMMWGDMCGNVFGLEFDMQSSGLFGLSKANQKNEHVKIWFQELQKGAYPGSRLHPLMYLHNDWVTSVKYIKENEVFISCCQDEDTSMYLGDLDESKTCYYFKMRKGAIALDYCPILNVIAAGGMDYCIRVWNPYVRSDATMIFKGFCKPVAKVAINSKQGDVIGLDKGNMVRIYSLKNQTLLQIISSRFVSSSRLPVTAMYFNPVLELVVLATSRLSVLRKTLKDEEQLAEHFSHNQPVMLLCYGVDYEEVISACEESTINIWNIRTGALVIQICNAHTRLDVGVKVPVAITAMCLDKTGRRLISAGRNGNVKVWNYSNGCALHSLSIPETNSITGLLNIEDKIYVCGWNRKLGMFVETAGSEEYKPFRTAHNEEILSIVKINQNTIATASYDGEMIMWTLDKGAVVARLHYLRELDRERNKSGKTKQKTHRKKQKEKQSNTLPSVGEQLSLKGSDDVKTRPPSKSPKLLKTTTGDSRSSKSANISVTSQHAKSHSFITPVSQRQKSPTGPHQKQVTSPLKSPTSSCPKLPTVRTKSSASRHKSSTHSQQKSSSDSQPKSPTHSQKKSPTPAHQKSSSPSHQQPNESTSPELPLPSQRARKKSDKRRESKQTKDRHNPLHGYTIEAMLMLDNRPINKKTANLLTAGACGWVRAWCVDKRGGYLIGQFNPVRSIGENTCALSTDNDNKYLFTADSQGYISVWDITHFCISEEAVGIMESECPDYANIRAEKFCFLRKNDVGKKLFEMKEDRRKAKCCEYSKVKDFLQSEPVLLSVYQGHVRGINAMLYVEKYKALVTASSDCTVRMWGLYGGYCGTFGQQTWDRIEETDTLQPLRISSEIKRVASASTLKILNAGKSTRWDRAMLRLRLMGFLDYKKCNEIRDAPLEVQTDGTPILGKFYKSRVRHRMLPALPKFFEIYDAVSVWHTVKYCEMDNVSNFRPQMLSNISEEQRQRVLTNERAGIVSTKKVKIKTSHSKGHDKTPKAQKKMKVKTAQEKIRLNFQNARKDVERIDVDCRLVGSRSKHASEPIIII